MFSRIYAGVFLLVFLMLMGGCSNPETRKQSAYDKAVAYYESGDSRNAVLELRKALQIDPRFTDARYYLGLCLLNRRSYDAALEEFKKVEAAEPDRNGLRPLLAEALVGAGKFAEGRDMCTTLLAQNPDSAELHDFLSRSLLGLGHPQTGKSAKQSDEETKRYLEEAAKEAQKALALDAKRVEPYMTLAMTTVLQHRNEAVPAPLDEATLGEISKHFEQAKAASPGNKDLLCRMAGIWLWSGDRSRAMREADTVMAMWPDDADAKVLKAEILFEDGKTEEASSELEQVAAGGLGGAQVDFLKGRILFSKGEFEKAGNQFRKVKDSVWGGYFLACCLERLGDRQHAQSQLEQVFDQDPAHEAARRSLFEIYMNIPNFSRASLQAEDAVRAAPQSPLGYLLRARVLMAQRHWAKAHEAIDEAMKRSPGLFEGLLLRSDLYLKEGNVEQCRNAIEEVIKAQPGNTAGYLMRNEFHLSLKEFAEAEKDARLAAGLAPGDPMVQVTLAMTRAAQGDIDGAYVLYEQVLQTAPDNVPARFGLAGLCVTRKDYGKAISTLGAIGDKDASYQRARIWMAELYDASGQSAEAASEYQQLLAKYPDAADAALGLFQHFSKFESYAEMEKLARETLERDPENVLGHLMLSEFNATRGRWPAAVDEMNAALRKQPDSARLWYRLGVLYSNAGRFSEGLTAFVHARTLQPDFEAAILAEARMLARTGKGEEAVDLCEKVLEKKWDNVGANLAMADIKSSLGRDSEAESAFRRIIASQPAVMVPYLRLIALYEKNKQFAKIEEVFEAAIAAAPSVAVMRVEYGRFWERMGKQEQARQQYARALELSPRNPAIQDLLARLSVGAGDYADAEQRLRARLAEAPSDISAQLNLALVLEKQGKKDDATNSLVAFVVSSKDPEATGMQLSGLFASRGNYEQIERLANSLLDADGTKYVAHYALGVARAGQDDEEGALAHFAEAAKLNEKIPLAKHAQGLVYARTNRFDDALAAFDAASQIDAQFLPAYTDAALVLIQKKEYAAAEALCEKALQVDSKAIKPVLVRATSQIKSNQTKAALDALYALLEQTPKQAPLIASLADVLCANGQFDEAIALCDRCITVTPNSPALLMKLGTVYQRKGDRDLAEVQFNRCVELAPNSPMTHNNLAWLLAEKGKLDEALIHAERAHALLPEHPAILDTLGWIQFQKGKTAQAITFIENSRRIAPKDPRILYHLGKAYAQAGRTADARATLTQALEIDPNFPEAEDAKQMLTAQLKTAQ